MIHSDSKRNLAGMGRNAPASIPAHHQTMKAIFTLADGTKVNVVSIHNPRATNALEFWIEDPTLPGNQHRIFCPVGEEAERYSPIEAV